MTWRSSLRLVAVLGYTTILMTSLFGYSSSRAQTATPTGTPTQVASKLTVVPASLTFGPEAVLPPNGVASKPDKVTLSVARNQPAPVTIEQPLMISDSDSPTPEFTIQPNSCSVIAPGNSCTILIVFQPTALRGRRGLLLITSNAANGVQSVSLLGRGKQGTLSINPTALSFPEGVVGAAAGISKKVTLTNRNPIQLTISSVTSTNPDAFPISNECPNVLQPSASCTVSASFSAFRNGVNRGYIEIVDNAAGRDRVALVGSGHGGPTVVRTPTPTATIYPTPVRTPLPTFPLRAFPVMH
jgi:hypothetical protein